MEMKTVRGQSGRVIQSENEKYSIQLYANGNWGEVAECYRQEFDTEEQAIEYFKSNRDFLHR